MNSIHKFFRKYIFSVIKALLLFFIINISIIILTLIIIKWNSTPLTKFSIEEFSMNIEKNGQGYTANDEALEILDKLNAWSMVIENTGKIKWEYHLPQNLNKIYTLSDVAQFSRWYLGDYPVEVWKINEGILVVGFPKSSLLRQNLSFEIRNTVPLFIFIISTFLVNIFLLIYLILHSIRGIEREIKPILIGIQEISHGNSVYLEEKGELSEINISLNMANQHLLQKDNTRSEWIRGISHDIRTPLSMILGYSSQIENDLSVSPEIRQQAKIICEQSDKIKNLVANLNLTTKLEYNSLSVKNDKIDLLEIIRQVITDFLNKGLSSAFEIELEENANTHCNIRGDSFLLYRMIYNLINNSITHNKTGCKIKVTVKKENNCFSVLIQDNGCGISRQFIHLLNSGEDIESLQQQLHNEHGLGLKIVKQIVRVHNGSISFSENTPKGLNVVLYFPTI